MKGVEQIAPLYDLVVGALDRGRLGAWRRELVGELNGDVLEVGVGTGLNLRHYGANARVVGIDPEPGLLPAARSRAAGRGYDLQRADARMLPFRNGSFDAVVSTLVFCSIPEPALALAEIGRVLRPGGRLIQLEHTRTGKGLADGFLDLIAPVWQVVAGGCRPNRDTAGLLEAAGWQILRHDRHYAGLIRLLVSTRPGAAEA